MLEKSTGFDIVFSYTKTLFFETSAGSVHGSKLKFTPDAQQQKARMAIILTIDDSRIAACRGLEIGLANQIEPLITKKRLGTPPPKVRGVEQPRRYQVCCSRRSCLPDSAWRPPPRDVGLANLVAAGCCFIVQFPIFSRRVPEIPCPFPYGVL